MSVLRPTDCLAPLPSSPGCCIWLNGRAESERAAWRPLWNAARLRACTDGGANLILERVRSSALLSPTLISGDMDSISPEAKQFFGGRSDCEIVSTPDQDKTDLTKCLELVAERIGRQPAMPAHVLIFGGLSGRFDHSLATINSLLNSPRIFSGLGRPPPVYLIDGENLTFVVGEGSHSIIVDRSLLTGICGVVPFCQRETRVTTSGLRWNLDDSPMEFGGLVSTSNEVVEDQIAIRTSAPLIVTLEVRSTMTYGSTQIRSLLDRSNVHVRDPESTVAKIDRLVQGGAGKLTVISDFDHTLTRSHDSEGGRCAVAHEVFGSKGRFPEIVGKFGLLEQKYARFEHLTEGEERIRMMEAWWRESNEVIAEQRISRSELSTLVKETNIQLRDRAADLMLSLEQKSIPTLIFSAGIGDVISLVLEQKIGRIPKNVHVISNMMEYDEQDRICGFADPLIHCFNKSGAMVGESSPLHPLISDRPNILLLGDALGDVRMAEGLGKEEERVLRIGYLNKKPDMLSHFTAAYDIVIVDDQTMEIPAEIMKMIK